MSTDVLMTSSVAASILPKNLLARLQTETEEGEMCSVALLIAHVVLGVIDTLKKGELRKLDANPGNEAVTRLVVRSALATGFFSIWMAVFETFDQTGNQVVAEPLKLLNGLA